MKQWLVNLWNTFFKQEEDRDAMCAYEEIPGSVFRFMLCGHDGPGEADVSFYGRKGTLGVPDDLSEEREGSLVAHMSCPRCRFEELKKLLIRCVLCGEAIMPGDPVALYWKRSGGITRENKRMGTMVDGHYIGCLKSDCCPSGGFFSGHWTSSGFVSAFEDGGTIMDEVVRRKKPIVGNFETGEIKVIDDEEET